MTFACFLWLSYIYFVCNFQKEWIDDIDMQNVSLTKRAYSDERVFDNETIYEEIFQNTRSELHYKSIRKPYI